ncbi:MAG: hypothetical protein GX581_01275 [Syntrophomonadaceae bacterium]|nr:hypothetical protein [Syntrophomonadaceae bacterium]
MLRSERWPYSIAARAFSDLNTQGGNRNLAAKELGMSRATIFRKIEKYSINDKE